MTDRIEDLKAKAVRLERQIADLQDKVDSGLARARVERTLSNLVAELDQVRKAIEELSGEQISKTS
jgi:predicted  nucleic acid-binding Zn-ribbon protein